MKIRENVPIASLTTMRLGGMARFVLEVETPEDVPAAYSFAEERKLPAWVMGGGANTIGRDEGFDGVIILNRIKGLFVQRGVKGENAEAAELVDARKLADDEFGEEIILSGMGGEIWDEVVEFACEHGYTGIEALSKIPGTLGAAPVQNIGAYGQDVAQVVVRVQAFDTKTHEFVTMEKSEMGLEYRRSRFNHGEDMGRYFIVSVTMRLTKGELAQPFYNSLQRYIDEHGETDFSPRNIRRMVAEIRGDKLPDPEKIASAGSFFKNVYVDKAGADKAEAKGIPVWRDAEGRGKINSGWLIEVCGLKGKELHGFRVSDKAALVLINESARSYADLAQAREEIMDSVFGKFGYHLEQEPVEIAAGSAEISNENISPDE